MMCVASLPRELRRHVLLLLLLLLLMLMMMMMMWGLMSSDVELTY